MSHIYDATKADKYFWRCRSCRQKLSIRVNSFFFQQGGSLGVYLCLLFLFAKQVSGSTALSLLEGKVSENTLYQWFHFYRGIISRYLLANQVPIGGPGHIVEIDESKWGKKPKYHRGYIPADKPWIFGALCRETKKVSLTVVDHRSREVLVPVIQQEVALGSTIYSDDWRAYRGLDQLGYQHQVVVHADNFVDPVTGVHTNTIEGFWGHAKGPFKCMHGVPNVQIPGYLDEIVFRWNEKETDLFLFLLQHISIYYNPMDQVPAGFQHLIGQEPAVTYNPLED